ncbi:MAG: winged helix-turn-helix domain-containing protein [Silvibacterium sp.]|nr:winged helix-turn-helix domain-containing protein [Silvibacterium sp.]
MKSFKAFRLDTANHILWRDGDRVSIAPKSFDVLAYMVEHAGRVVSQDEILEALWPETYVNPEVLRKYILEVRKTLGDRAESPEFIETVPKRGYRFVAPVTAVPVPDEHTTEPTPSLLSNVTQETAEPLTAAPPEPEHSSRKRLLWKLALIPVFAVLVAVALVRRFEPRANGRNIPPVNTDTSIAVLPFADMSPAKDDEYFSDGLAEQLINDLAKVSGVRVAGRSSSFQFRDKNEDLRDVGRKLGVANVLEGSVRRQGNHVRITAELVKTHDGFQLWSQTYDREINDIFAVQDEIALATTEALQVKLLGGNGQLVTPAPRSVNPDAYQAYLQGNYFLGRGAGKEDIDKALAYADTAIKLDEGYAPAWALRASVQNMIAEDGLTNVTEGFRKARDDAERAIALDPASASAYLALARTQIYHDWDWDTADTCLTKAAALAPGSAEVPRMRSYLSRALGHLDEAVQLDERSVALDPLRANARLSLGFLLYMAGRYDEAQAELYKALELNPQGAFVHADLGKILMAEGKPQEALAEFEKESSDWEKLTDLALVYHTLGREHDSNAALSELIAKNDSDSAYQIAEVYAFRGESDKSFEWLARAYKQRDSGLPDIKVDPLMKNLHRDPRYRELLTKLRLPVAE